MSSRVVTTDQSRGLYATPRWPIALLLSTRSCPCCSQPAPAVRLPFHGAWLEPCAGEGSICYATSELHHEVRWTAVERDPDLFERFLKPALERRELAAAHHADFFEWAKTTTERFGVALLNPAFPDATEFVAECRRLALWTITLQRLDWLSGVERLAFFKQHGEPELWVLADRPRFRGRGQDSGDYGFFVWGPGISGGRIHHLPAVPLAQRQEHRLQTRLGV